MVNVRYMVNDVEAAIEFYVTHLGFLAFKVEGMRARAR
jgi:catechol 2,3-dioxygenase-like lactoylglutathione lyase family enzyme